MMNTAIGDEPVNAITTGALVVKQVGSTRYSYATSVIFTNQQSMRALPRPRAHNGAFVITEIIKRYTFS